MSLFLNKSLSGFGDFVAYFIVLKFNLEQCSALSTLTLSNHVLKKGFCLRFEVFLPIIKVCLQHAMLASLHPYNPLQSTKLIPVGNLRDSFPIRSLILKFLFYFLLDSMIQRKHGPHLPTL